MEVAHEHKQGGHQLGGLKAYVHVSTRMFERWVYAHVSWECGYSVR